VQVHTVPGGCGRGEEARRGAEFRVGVEANAEAIGIVLSATSVLCDGGNHVSSNPSSQEVLRRG
jgi:hypothetical protein